MVFVNRTDLVRGRGWTDELIDELLGLPDLGGPNPHRSGGPLQRFLLPRVEEAERSERFRGVQRDREPRRVAARRGARTREERLDQYIDDLEIRLLDMSEEELIDAACDHYNNRRKDEGGGRMAFRDSPRDFLDRIMVNYLRHDKESGYDDNLDNIFGRTGARDGRRRIKRMVLVAIAARYPRLAAECARQQQTSEAQWAFERP
jgi:hypothetical protein